MPFFIAKQLIGLALCLGPIIFLGFIVFAIGNEDED